MAIQIQKATKRKSKLRLAFDGPAGSGKTFTALAVGTAMAKRLGGRVGLIDTERGSASLYADKFDFDVIELQDFAPDRYVEAIHALEDAGYAVIVIDSLSHAWEGKGGALDLKDRFARASKSKNEWAAWRDVTPMHNRLVDSMLQSPKHVIATMRTHTEYVLEADEKGKQVPKKVGMAPIQRKGMDFEFTIVGDLDQQHVLTIGKTRCDAVDGQVYARPGADLAKILLDWLETGEAELPPPPRDEGAASPSSLRANGREESEVRVADPTAPAPAGNPAKPDFAKRITDATTEKELHAVALEIKKAKVFGPDRDALAAAWERRKIELTQKAAAA